MRQTKGAFVQNSRRLTFGALAALLVAAVAAAPASAATLKGTVVHRNSHAHSFVIALAHGRLAAVHARNSPRPGRVVRVSARRLRNGTYAARSVRVVGRHRHVRMRGTVTYSRGRAFTLSSRGASILVHRRARGARAAASDGAPPVGSVVQVDANVDDNGDVEANDVAEEGQDTNGIDLEGKVLAIDTTARTLSISADDDGESGAALVVQVPAGVDMTGFSVGQEVELTVTRNPDGTFVLQQGLGDDNEQEADDNGSNGGEDNGSGGGD
jgi:hypothetical protein